jgi:hypothetical protein
MQTRHVVQILGDPHPAFVFIWVIMLFLGLPKGRLQFPDLRLNTELSPMLSLRPCGFANFLLNSIDLSSRLQSFIVTIFLQSTWQPIQFNIVVPSILRLTFTLFVKR